MDQNSQTEGTSSSKNPAELALDLYNLLVPHPSDVRVRAIQSVMASLGESALPQRQGSGGSQGLADPNASGDFADLKIGPKALKWVQKHGVTRAMLDEIFHLSGSDFDITASSVPGASKKEMTVNCYLLEGLRGLLKSDVGALDDGDSIALCKRLTAYDKNNHTTNRSAVGNRMSGTRPHFTLTGPGETAAAELVKLMTASRS